MHSGASKSHLRQRDREHVLAPCSGVEERIGSAEHVAARKSITGRVAGCLRLTVDHGAVPRLLMLMMLAPSRSQQDESKST